MIDRRKGKRALRKLNAELDAALRDREARLVAITHVLVTEARGRRSLEKAIEDALVKRADDTEHSMTALAERLRGILAEAEHREQS